MTVGRVSPWGLRGAVCAPAALAAQLQGPFPVTRGFPSSLPGAEFEIELEGSQTLRILCYEKCYHKTRLTKEGRRGEPQTGSWAGPGTGGGGPSAARGLRGIPPRLRCPVRFPA